VQDEHFALHADIEDKHWWFVARRQILRDVIRAVLPPKAGKLVIDVGCGTGANIAYLAEDYDAIGIDTNESAILHARERFSGVEFVQGFAPQDLGGRESEADLFLLTDVIEHVPDDFAFVSTLLENAKPGSYALITVPALMSLWSPHDVSFGHYRRYDLDRFRLVWDGLPLQERILSYYNARLYPIAQTMRTLTRLRGKTLGKGSTDFDMPPPFVNKTLTGIFSGEIGPLLGSMTPEGSDQRPRAPFGAGVSLMALLQRGDGPLPPRTKPASVPPDPFAPKVQKEFENE
jgi:SAM-dependent methyltransferase